MKSNNIIAIGMEYVGIATGSMFGVDLDEIKINTHKLGYWIGYNKLDKKDKDMLK